MYSQIQFARKEGRGLWHVCHLASSGVYPCCKWNDLRFCPYSFFSSLILQDRFFLASWYIAVSPDLKAASWILSSRSTSSGRQGFWLQVTWQFSNGQIFYILVNITDDTLQTLPSQCFCHAVCSSPFKNMQMFGLWTVPQCEDGTIWPHSDVPENLFFSVSSVVCMQVWT